MTSHRCGSASRRLPRRRRPEVRVHVRAVVGLIGARVGRVARPAVEPGAEVGLVAGVARLAGDVRQLERVVGPVVQLLGGALREREVKV